MIDIVSQVAEAKTALVVAGGLVVGVYAAIMAIDKIKLVIIERDASREYYDRYGS